MVLDPIPQSLPVHFFGSRPQPPTSPSLAQSILYSRIHLVNIYEFTYQFVSYLQRQSTWRVPHDSFIVHISMHPLFMYLHTSLFIYLLWQNCWRVLQNAWISQPQHHFLKHTRRHEIFAIFLFFCNFFSNMYQECRGDVYFGFKKWCCGWEIHAFRRTRQQFCHNK